MRRLTLLIEPRDPWGLEVSIHCCVFIVFDTLEHNLDFLFLLLTVAPNAVPTPQCGDQNQCPDNSRPHKNLHYRESCVLEFLLEECGSVSVEHHF